MLTCPNYTPHNCDGPGIVQANPDIAGIGVLLSFLATTCFAFILAFVIMFLDRYHDYRRILLTHITSRKEELYSPKPKRQFWRTPEFWHRVLSKNLLAFSDTQLVTGLAVQFAAMLKHCTISIYHFQIVTELAFLTTVTHLLALVALRNYFVKNKWINLPRIFFMLANLSMLGYTSYVAYSYQLAGLRVSADLACFFKGVRPQFKAAFAGRWALLLIGAIGGHISLIFAMYFLHSRDDEGGDGEKKSRKVLAFLQYWGAVFRTWVLAPIYAVYGLVMAGVALSKTQALGTATVVINGSEKEWGFGQFLPMLLLALPVFAGWESFWEEKDEDRENRFGRKRAGTFLHSRSAENAHEMERFLLKTPYQQETERDASMTEVRIESDGPSAQNSPRQRSSTSPGRTSHSRRTSESRPIESSHRSRREGSHPHRRESSHGRREESHGRSRSSRNSPRARTQSSPRHSPHDTPRLSPYQTPRLSPHHSPRTPQT